MRALTAFCFIFFSRAALACSTCYGNPDSPQTSAMNVAILFMLGVVAVMLTLFAAFFVHLRARARQLAVEGTGRAGAVTFVEVKAYE